MRILFDSTRFRLRKGQAILSSLREGRFVPASSVTESSVEVTVDAPGKLSLDLIEVNAMDLTSGRSVSIALLSAGLIDFTEADVKSGLRHISLDRCSPFWVEARDPQGNPVTGKQLSIALIGRTIVVTMAETHRALLVCPPEPCFLLISEHPEVTVWLPLGPTSEDQVVTLVIPTSSSQIGE